MGSDRKPELFLIIPTYRQFEYARACLKSFYDNKPDCDALVAIIDDGSPDWYDYGREWWAPYPHLRVHFAENDGLTRSWNKGLRMARDVGARYTICGNSDLLFTPGWYEPLRDGLKSVDLVGPVSNAPGHCSWQDVRKYAQFEVSDDSQKLAEHAVLLKNKPMRAIRTFRINGFCMMAETNTWWSGAYDDTHVFDPKRKLTGNEDELQIRWLRKGRRIGYVSRSYVFHYRSVSRPAALALPASRSAYRGDGDEGTGGLNRLRSEAHSQPLDASVA
jgi:GT2 family glycosyltransferase